MKQTLAVFGNPSDFVSYAQGVCRINTEIVISDAFEFSALWGQAALLRTETSGRELLAIYHKMCDLYHGELLAGDYSNEYVAPVRVMYRETFLSAMIHASKVAIFLKDPKLAVWFAQLAIQDDNSREEAYVALVRAQLADQQRGSALDTFHRCRKYLSNEFGLDPSSEMMKLYDSLLVMDSQ